MDCGGVYSYNIFRQTKKNKVKILWFQKKDVFLQKI